MPPTDRATPKSTRSTCRCCRTDRMGLARRALLAATFLAPAMPAIAQPGPCPFSASSCQVQATGIGAMPSPLAAWASDTINSRRYPLAANAEYFNTTTNTSSNGSNSFTITGGPVFTTAYVGRTITIGAAGGGGSPVSTTIASVIDATHITTVANALTTGANASYVAAGTPDDALFRTMVSNLPAVGGTIEVF